MIFLCPERSESYLARYFTGEGPAASRPVGEGSAVQAARAQMLLPLFSIVSFLCLLFLRVILSGVCVAKDLARLRTLLRPMTDTGASVEILRYSGLRSE